MIQSYFKLQIRGSHSFCFVWINEDVYPKGCMEPPHDMLFFFDPAG